MDEQKKSEETGGAGELLRQNIYRKSTNNTHYVYKVSHFSYGGMRNKTHETCAINAKVKCYRDTFM